MQKYASDWHRHVVYKDSIIISIYEVIIIVVIFHLFQGLCCFE
jgi:hypothetical protein